jgi:uncharacterized membrane protein SirB2
MHTFIINTTLLTLYPSDVFQPSNNKVVLIIIYVCVSGCFMYNTDRYSALKWIAFIAVIRRILQDVDSHD